MDIFSVTCFAAKELATKAIHYKTAISLGVRSILGVGVFRLELLRKFNAVSLSKVLYEVGQSILW